MRRDGIGANDNDDVGVLDGIEILSAGRSAVGLAEAITGRRVADTGAGVDVVVAERGADQFLHQESLLIGAARRGDAADRVFAVLGLNALEFGSGVVYRLFPTDFTPFVGDLGADHRLEDTLFVGRITPGKPALDAGMAAIGLAILI